MTKVDQLLEFGSLHMRTCGPDEVDAHVDGTTMHQRCSCGATIAMSLSLEECEALVGVLRSDPAFGAAMRRVGRRVVQ